MVWGLGIRGEKQVAVPWPTHFHYNLLSQCTATEFEIPQLPHLDIIHPHRQVGTQVK